MRQDRLNDMESYILKHGTSTLEELSAYFDVSISTIRRDVMELVKRKPFDKVYGGVSVRARILSNSPVSDRLCYNGQAKQLIGKLAADLVDDGMSVFLDSGSTTIQILPFLAQKNNITIISHNLMVLFEAAKYPSLNIIALGGAYNRDIYAFISNGILEELSRMSISLVFLAAGGVSLNRGLTSNNYSDVEIKKTVVKWNRNLVLVADHLTFSKDALLTFCKFDEVGAIITDQMPSHEYITACKMADVHLITPQATCLSKREFIAI
ncbi:MAG: DeoR/GlpR family DNA-binding transcription regulator [Eubacteriales bacterium]|nr:DeoR/GlpR family DNA-binding transcription regulator [Eubacteriales bacterium]